MSKPITEEELFKRLRKNRKKIIAGEEARDENNLLYVEGGERGVTATAMARAMEPQSDDIRYLAERVRQVQRAARDSG